MRRVLVTGFEAFNGEAVNPSALVARSLDGRVIEERTVVGVVLSCAFHVAVQQLEEHIARVQPELVICLGQAGGRKGIAVERVAINVDDAPIPDNLGATPVDTPVVPDGPVGYWSSLPIKAVVSALRQVGLPAEVSQTAGTYVCNHVFYALMHRLSTLPDVRGGFLHLPYLPSQVASMSVTAPSLSLADQQLGIVTAIATALRTKGDTRVEGGALHG